MAVQFLNIYFLEALISSYGYLAVFVLMFLESFALPIPSEVVLPFTGFLIAIGIIDPYFGFVDAVVGSIVGSVAGYLLGYFLGVDVFLKYSRRIGLSDSGYEKAINWMKYYGAYFAFLSRLVPAVRSISSIVCGAFEMDTKRFIGYSTLGISIWSFALIYLGFTLTKNWVRIAQDISTVTPYIIVVLIAGLVAYFYFGRLRNRQ